MGSGRLSAGQTGRCHLSVQAFGRWVTSMDLLAAAMLELAMVGREKKMLNTAELNVLAGRACR